MAKHHFMVKIRHLIFIVFIAISISASSQFSKGDKLIGGSVNFYSNNTNYSSTGNLTNNYNGINTGITPRFSWVIKDHLMNGIFLSGNYSHSKSTGGDPKDYSTTNNYNYGVGYFIRNFGNFSQQFGWFIEYNALLNYNSSKTEYSSQGNVYSNKTNGLSAGLNIIPGLYYQASHNVVIEGAFGGVSATYYRSNSLGLKTRNFNVGLNFPSSFSLGVQFLLNRGSNKS